MPRNCAVYLVAEAILAGFGGFILPIYVLYFRFYNITLFQVALLAAVFEAAVLISEIPTGLFADRWGRKLSVTIGFALFFFSGLVFIQYRNLTGFLVAEVFFGVAEAFISGAAEALAVDSLPAEGRNALLQRLYTNRSRVRIAVKTVFMLAAGYAFLSDLSVTFYPVLFGGAAGLVTTFFFTSDARSSGAGEPARFLAPLRSMYRQIGALPVLKVIFLLSLIANFSFEAADQYWQVLLSEVFTMDVRLYGFFTAAGAVLAFVLVGPIVRKFAGGLSTPLLILLASGVFVSTLPTAPVGMIPLVLILYFVTRELISPLFSVAINSVIESEGRATFLSGYNLTCSIGEVASGLIIGTIASMLGLPVVFIIGGSVLVVAVAVTLFSSRSDGTRPSATS